MNLSEVEVKRMGYRFLEPGEPILIGDMVEWIKNADKDGSQFTDILEGSEFVGSLVREHPQTRFARKF